MSRFIRRSIALAWVAALAAAPAACAHSSTSETSEAADTDQGAASAVTLQIISHNLHPIELSVDTGVGWRRLGVLPGHGATAFTVPLRLLTGSTQLRVSARRVGSAIDAVKETITVKPGSRVLWTIEPTVTFSQISVE